MVPHLPADSLSETEAEAVLENLMDQLVDQHNIENYVLWYYTPMALGWTRQLKPLAVVYDCMDELSAFKNAPVELKQREVELFSHATLCLPVGKAFTNPNGTSTLMFMPFQAA
ncbi:MAG: hypothetical protein WKF84_08135 [Pyrinomonadaceae bacterium]